MRQYSYTVEHGEIIWPLEITTCQEKNFLPYLYLLDTASYTSAWYDIPNDSIYIWLFSFFSIIPYRRIGFATVNHRTGPCTLGPSRSFGKGTGQTQWQSTQRMGMGQAKDWSRRSNLSINGMSFLGVSRWLYLTVRIWIRFLVTNQAWNPHWTTLHIALRCFVVPRPVYWTS